MEWKNGNNDQLRSRPENFRPQLWHSRRMRIKEWVSEERVGGRIVYGAHLTRNQKSSGSIPGCALSRPFPSPHQPWKECSSWCFRSVYTLKKSHFNFWPPPPSGYVRAWLTLSKRVRRTLCTSFSPQVHFWTKVSMFDSKSQHSAAKPEHSNFSISP